MTFNDLNLNKPLLNALDELGYTVPTAIQEKVFSVVMSGRDVCGIAQTGTGKTLAYLLPCLRQYQFSKEKLPQMIVLVPTRELVVQVVETVQQLSKYQNLIVVGVYGGVNTKTQSAEVLAGVDVLVATPGRLIDLISNGSLKLKNVKRLVIDEVDEMLSLGFRPQLTRIFDLLPPRRQNLLFSATLSEEVEALLDEYFVNPVRVEAAPAGTPLENIEQSAYAVPNFYTKVNLLELLLGRHMEMNRVLVFAATKQLADDLFEELKGRFLDHETVAVIHSNKSQNHRFDSVRRFESGQCRVLIATDIIARGLDLTDVSHVINFDLPDVPESYIHRIGRTGRADKRGAAISFITEREQEYQAAIEALMNYEIPIRPLPEELIISNELTPDEQPKAAFKALPLKPTRPEDGGGAYHEKMEKNKKVNVRRDYEEEKRRKYGRPIKKSRPNN
ncbi:DEAD/DEAH box helicase [Tellurirhabdus rosea]|uniref:DEAD/DEAH box helicase n=1 Tax=Tellurirhabdus rosea TaxID=2674997 RepID=UPI0022504F48|nr:DEAD/DEAH box helicase [Tellurirhabdus rosea]